MYCLWKLISSLKVRKDNKSYELEQTVGRVLILPPVLQVSPRQTSGSVIRAVVRHHLALTATTFVYGERGKQEDSAYQIVSERELCKLTMASLCVRLMPFGVCFELVHVFFIIIFMT